MTPSSGRDTLLNMPFRWIDKWRVVKCDRMLCVARCVKTRIFDVMHFSALTVLLSALFFMSTIFCFDSIYGIVQKRGSLHTAASIIEFTYVAQSGSSEFWNVSFKTMNEDVHYLILVYVRLFGTTVWSALRTDADVRARVCEHWTSALTRRIFVPFIQAAIRTSIAFDSKFYCFGLGIFPRSRHKTAFWSIFLITNWLVECL